MPQSLDMVLLVVRASCATGPYSALQCPTSQFEQLNVIFKSKSFRTQYYDFQYSFTILSDKEKMTVLNVDN